MSDDLRLSPSGQRRRDELCAMLQHDMRIVHEHRRAWRRTAVAAGILAVIALPALLLVRSPNQPPATRRLKPPESVPPPAVPRIVIIPSRAPWSVRIVGASTWDGVTIPPASRISTAPPTVRITLFSDDALLDERVAMGEPAGLATIDGETMLLPR